MIEFSFNFSFCLLYWLNIIVCSEENTDEESLKKKFVRVTGSATIDHVCTFLKKKLNLQDEKQVHVYIYLYHSYMLLYHFQKFFFFYLNHICVTKTS